MAVFATQEWLDEMARLLNEDPVYAEVAKDWEGDFLYIIEPDDLQPTPGYYYMDLYHGKCRKAVLLKDPSEVKAEFELSAPYSVWKKILTGELDGNKAMMTRKLKFKGNITKVMKNVKATQAYAKALAPLKTEYEK
jgi:putative sterol carrier protein